MQFLATLAALAVGASAATLQPRQNPVQHIQNLTAACIPHSVMCQYQFQVNDQPEVFPTGIPCNITLAGPDRLPAVDQAECSDPIVKFGFQPYNGGLNMSLYIPANTRVTLKYCAYLPPSDFVIDDHGSVQDQRYVGPNDFLISVANCPLP